MSASLGTKTYNEVTWASGDYITEAKMDYMTDNDQAYDSHSAQGLIVNNEKSLGGKNTTGDKLNIAKINSSNQLEIGDASLAGNPPILFNSQQWLSQLAFDTTTIPTLYDALSGGDFTNATGTMSDITGVTGTITSLTDGVIMAWGVAVCSNDTASAGASLCIDIGGTEYGRVDHEQATADDRFVLSTFTLKVVSDTTTTIKLKGARYSAGTATFKVGQVYLMAIFIPYSGI
jgi:hypothetical protein